VRNGRGQVERISCCAVSRFAYGIATCLSRIIGLWNCEYTLLASSLPHGKNDFYYARCLRLINIGPSQVFSTLNQFLLLWAIYAEWLANGASTSRRLERAIYLIFSQVLNHIISVFKHSTIVWLYEMVSHVIWL
jgi:hypothetical protein